MRVADAEHDLRAARACAACSACSRRCRRGSPPARRPDSANEHGDASSADRVASMAAAAASARRPPGGIAADAGDAELGREAQMFVELIAVHDGRRRVRPRSARCSVRVSGFSRTGFGRLLREQLLDAIEDRRRRRAPCSAAAASRRRRRRRSSPRWCRRRSRHRRATRRWRRSGRRASPRAWRRRARRRPRSRRRSRRAAARGRWPPGARPRSARMSGVFCSTSVSVSSPFDIF